MEIEKRANKLFKNCQFQNAKILLLRVQEKKYHGALVNYEISQLYMNQNKLDKAKKYLKQSIELNPLSSKAHRDLSSLLIKQKSYDDAHFHIEKSLDLDYADPHSHLNLGMIMKANKDYVNAELYFLSSLDINPKYVTCMLELVDLQLIMGNQEKAKKASHDWYYSHHEYAKNRQKPINAKVTKQEKAKIKTIKNFWKLELDINFICTQWCSGHLQCQ